MIGKKLLLAGIAVGALAAAGSANAIGVSAIVGTSTTQTSNVAVSSGSTYKLAKEVNLTNGISSALGQFATVFTFGNPLAAGSYTFTATYTGATFATAISGTTTGVSSAAANGSATVPVQLIETTGTTSTAVVSSGGGIGSNTVTFTVTVSSGDTITKIYLEPGLTVTSAPVSVAATVVSNLGVTADPSITAPIITQATAPTFTAAVVPTALGSQATIATGNPAAFNTINSNPLGTVTLSASNTVYRDLKGDPSAASDITAAQFSLTGDFTTVKILPSATSGTPSSPTLASASETVNLTNYDGSTITLKPSAISSAANAPIIPPSAYNVTVTGTLASSYAATGPIALASGPLQSLTVANGYTYVVPWVNSATQASSSGNTTVIRVTNGSTLGTAGATVFGVLYNATGLTGATSSANLGTLGPANTGKELVITSTTLQNAFGNFGRGDLKLIIADAGITVTNGGAAGGTAVPSGYIVKRLFSGANGGLTEMSILSGDPGTVAEGATQVVQ